ncbi:hypothetical protein GAMM_130029 [Gammaproteobacteria bacterium]
MQNTFSQQQQKPIKIGVFPIFNEASKSAINNNAAEETKVVSITEKSFREVFKELVDHYSFLGKRMEHLTKDEQYNICLAYIEYKYSSWPFDKEVKLSEEVDVPLDIETLRLLKDNIYNSKARALELIKEAVIDSYSCDVSEALDDAIEAARGMYEDNYSFSSVNYSSVFNAFKKAVER